MALDEFTVVVKARALINQVAPSAIPVPLDAYARHVGARIRVEEDLEPDEPGWSFQKADGSFCICVNGNDRAERQRFTICHELAHIVLCLPSEHSRETRWSWAKRPPNEIFCDVFAAELLLPYKLFKPLVDRSDIGLSAVDRLAEQFDASTVATGSRFATFSEEACAFVLSEGGKVRYSALSKTMREMRAWISPRSELPHGSVSHQLRVSKERSAQDEFEPDVWFADWDGDGVLMEAARFLPRWDQTIALLWFADECVLATRTGRVRHEIEESGLEELDGILPWPGRKRRRR